MWGSENKSLTASGGGFRAFVPVRVPGHGKTAIMMNVGHEAQRTLCETTKEPSGEVRAEIGLRHDMLLRYDERRSQKNS